jgi:exonuclease SbcC
MLPCRLELENFLSHSNSTINFNGLNLSLIVGETDGNLSISNGAGKTSIFEAIAWALTGQCRVDSIDLVIRHGAKNAIVTLEFIMPDNVEYKIIRKRNFKTSSDVRLYVKNNNEWNDVSGRTIKETNKKILDIVRFDYDTFVNSIYFRQNCLFDFSDKLPSEKLDLLKRLLHLEFYDKCKKEIKGQLEDSKNSIQVLTGEMSILQTKPELILNLEEQKISLNVELAELKGSIPILQNQISKLQEEVNKRDGTNLEDANNIIAKYKSAVSDVALKSNSVSSLKNQVDAINIETMKEQYKVKYEEMKKLSTHIASFDRDLKINEKDILLKKAGSIKGSLDIVFDTLNSIKKLGDRCFVCDSPITQSVKDSLITTKAHEIDEYKKNLIQYDALIKDIEKKIRQFDEDKNLYDNIKSSLVSLKYDMESFKALKDRLSSSTELYRSACDLLSSLEGQYKQAVLLLDESNTKSKDVIIKQLELHKNMLKNAEKHIQDISFKLGTVEQSLKTINDNKERSLGILTNLEKERHLLVRNTHIFDIFNQAPVFIINSVLEEIEHEANKILSDISSIPMSLLIGHNTFDIRVFYRDNEINFSSLSGGEKTKVSIALRLALSQILARRSGGQVKILLLDEVASALDELSMESLIFVLNKLQERFRILLITHDSRLKEYFTDFITVRMSNGSSHIVQEESVSTQINKNL